MVSESEDETPSIFVEYSTQLFTPQTALNIGRRFIVLLSAVLEKPNECLDNVGLMDTAERDEVLCAIVTL